jgi:hypothetical protein
MLLAVGYITGRKANDDGYFVGNKQSLWWMVALGMLSDSMPSSDLDVHTYGCDSPSLPLPLISC